MKSLLTLFLATFLSTTPALAEGVCWQHDDAVPILEKQAQDAHGMAKVLKHDQAESFLEVVNNTGDPTDFHADEIIIVALPTASVAMIFMTKGDCTDPSPIQISADILIKALKAASAVSI